MGDKPNAARERVLDVAEKLFTERGYTAVTLQDIAQALGLKQASLYYHVPGGKEALFIEVTERGLKRHRQGLETAIAAAQGDLRAELRAVAQWLLSQPPIDTSRMMQSDMPAITDQHEARRLEQMVYAALLAPVENIFLRAQARGQMRPLNAGVLAGSLVTMLESINILPDRYGAPPKTEMADMMIDVIVDGLRPR